MPRILKSHPIARPKRQSPSGLSRSHSLSSCPFPQPTLSKLHSFKEQSLYGYPTQPSLGRAPRLSRSGLHSASQSASPASSISSKMCGACFAASSSPKIRTATCSLLCQKVSHHTHDLWMWRACRTLAHVMRASTHSSSLTLQGCNASICTAGNAYGVSMSQNVECVEADCLTCHRWNRAIDAIKTTIYMLQDPCEPQNNPSIRHTAYRSIGDVQQDPARL